MVTLAAMLYLALSVDAKYAYTDKVSDVNNKYLYINHSDMVYFAIDKYGRRVPDVSHGLPYSRFIEESRKSAGDIKERFRLLIASGHYGEHVYEFNSFRLVYGLISNAEYGKGRFVPEIGSKIKSMDDYLASSEVSDEKWIGDSGTSKIRRPGGNNSTTAIYNLPGFITPIDTQRKVRLGVNFLCNPLHTKIN